MSSVTFLRAARAAKGWSTVGSSSDLSDMEQNTLCGSPGAHALTDGSKIDRIEGRGFSS